MSRSTLSRGTAAIHARSPTGVQRTTSGTATRQQQENASCPRNYMYVRGGRGHHPYWTIAPWPLTGNDRLHSRNSPFNIIIFTKFVER
jgi:hypothetical protein